MPFARPSLAVLRDRMRRDFSARLPGADALLKQSNLRVIADVFAAVSHLHFGYQAWQADQLFPDTCETAGLERWAAVFGLFRLSAVAATGTVSVQGSPGAVLPLDEEFQRPDRVRYRTTDGATLDGTGAGTVHVIAVEAGAAGDGTTGTELATVLALPGILPTATIAAPGIAGGADVETDALLRTRLLARIQTPPHGGALSDYVDWTLEVPGVTRVWISPQELDVGTVTVRFTMDNAAHLNGIPTAADLALVLEHLNVVRPVTAEVFVVAPIPVPVDLTIDALVGDTPTIRAAVVAELTDTIYRNAVPGGTLYLSWLWEAISQASGERHHRLLAPTSDVVLSTGQLPVLGALTYVH